MVSGSPCPPPRRGIRRTSRRRGLSPTPLASLRGVSPRPLASCRGCSQGPPASRRASGWSAGSFPIQRPFLPCIDKADRKLGEENHHRRPAGPADFLQAHGLGKEEGRFEVENDEQNGDQVESHVEIGRAHV